MLATSRCCPHFLILVGNFVVPIPFRFTDRAPDMLHSETPTLPELPTVLASVHTQASKSGTVVHVARPRLPHLGSIRVTKGNPSYRVRSPLGAGEEGPGEGMEISARAADPAICMHRVSRRSLPPAITKLCGKRMISEAVGLAV